MAIDGLIILDQNGRAVIQSGFRSSTPAYPLLHIEALNDALSRSGRPEDVDPVLYISSLQYDVPSACCHVKKGDLRVLCPVTGDLDPLYVFSFIQTFLEILNVYFGEISAETLKDNFDVVYQLLEETLDAGGHPSTTSPNALRDIVLPPSLLQKMLSVAGVAGLANQGSNAHPFGSPIPWRKMGVRYNNNEIFFDLAEELKAVVSKSGSPISSTVFGKIHSNCKLSGTPDLVLTFTNPQSLTDCSFHPCVRLQRWSRDKHLSFVPPDGRFTLMEYRHSPSALYQVPVPVAVKVAAPMEEYGGTIEITMMSRVSPRTMENMSVEMYLGEGCTGASCMTSNGASWSYEPRSSTLRWEIRSFPPSSTFTLRGSFTSSIQYPRPSHALRIRCEVNQHSFSGLKVDQLKMTGEMYKPYKGVRGRANVDIEWRW